MLNERQERALKMLPADARKEVARTFEEKPRPLAAIRAYCLMCKQGSKMEIRDCQDEICPLQHLRPHQPKDANQEQQ